MAVKKQYGMGANIMFVPKVNVTQVEVDAEVEKVRKKMNTGEELTELEIMLRRAIKSMDRRGSKHLLPQEYCVLRDL